MVALFISSRCGGVGQGLRGYILGGVAFYHDYTHMQTRTIRSRRRFGVVAAVTVWNNSGRRRRMRGHIILCDSSCARFNRHRFTHRGRPTVKRKTRMINEGCRHRLTHVRECVCVFMRTNVCVGECVGE